LLHLGKRFQRSNKVIDLINLQAEIKEGLKCLRAVTTIMACQLYEQNSISWNTSAKRTGKQWANGKVYTWLFSRPPKTCLTILSSSKDEGFPFDLGSRVHLCKLSSKQRRNSCASSCCPGLKSEDNSGKSCQGIRQNFKTLSLKMAIHHWIAKCMSLV
jgi:hypothetical protein